MLIEASDGPHLLRSQSSSSPRLRGRIYKRTPRRKTVLLQTAGPLQELPKLDVAIPLPGLDQSGPSPQSQSLDYSQPDSSSLLASYATHRAMQQSASGVKNALARLDSNFRSAPLVQSSAHWHGNGEDRGREYVTPDALMDSPEAREAAANARLHMLDSLEDEVRKSVKMEELAKMEDRLAEQGESKPTKFKPKAAGLPMEAGDAVDAPNPPPNGDLDSARILSINGSKASIIMESSGITFDSVPLDQLRQRKASDSSPLDEGEFPKVGRFFPKGVVTPWTLPPHVVVKQVNGQGWDAR